MVSAKSAQLQLPELGLWLELKAADVTLSETVAPYGQVTVTCVAPPPADRDAIDPRRGIRATLTLQDTASPWGGQDTTRTFDLAVRARPVMLSDHELQLQLATDESVLIASALIATAPYAPASATCRQVVGYVLGTIGATLQTGDGADANLLPNTVSWTPGQSGWDFLEPILQASGLRLFCDEQRRWWLVRSDALGAGWKQLHHDSNLTAVGETIDLDSGGYYDGVVVTYTYDDSSGATHTSYDVASPGSDTFDLVASAGQASWLQSQPHPSGGGTSVMQGAAYPTSGGEYFAWHAVPGSNGTSTPYETLVVDHFNASGGLLDTMVLVDAGHGTSIGVEFDGINYQLWVHWLAPGEGLRNDLIRVKYVPGATQTRAQALANYATVMPHSWDDIGGAVPVTSFDFSHDYAVMHLGSTATGKRTYVRRRISDLKAGIRTQYGATIVVPEGPPTLQGFTTIDGSFFRYVGAFNEPAGDPAMVEQWSWASGQLLDKMSTSKFGRNSDGSYPGGRHEPEGLQVYRAGDGTPYLDIGVMLNTSGSYAWQVYRQPLTRGLGGAQRVLSLSYNTAKPAAGAAAAIVARRKLFGRSLPLTGVADFGVTPGQSAGVVLEDGGDELQVSLSSISWHLPDATMDITTRDVVPLGPTAWLRARPGLAWSSVPSGISWANYDPTNLYAAVSSWDSAPVGLAWQGVAAGVSWQAFDPAGS